MRAAGDPARDTQHFARVTLDRVVNDQDETAVFGYGDAIREVKAIHEHSGGLVCWVIDHEATMAAMLNDVEQAGVVGVW